MAFIERLTADEASQASLIYTEHLVRYEFAQQFVQAKTVLEVACGSGYGTKVLLQAGAKKIIGIDIDAEVIAAAKKNYGHDQVEFITAPATSLPLADASMEVITSFETIEHITDYETYLQELARVLTGEGVALISTPNYDVFSQKNPFHIKEFTKNEFIDVLKKYFKEVVVLEQKNGLASVISVNDTCSAVSMPNNTSQPLYFIAICSQVPLPAMYNGFGSINVQALQRWEQNPGWRLVNWLYGLGQKIGFLK